MPHLETACGTRFLVDEETFAWAQSESWFLRNGYPCRYHPLGERYLHRELMNFPIGHVHHDNENPLDCRRENLQVLSVAEHFAVHRRAEKIKRRSRQAGPRSASGYKGVSYHKRFGVWTAQLTVDGVNRTLGRAKSAEEAALLYDAAVLAFIGNHAYTNLITAD